MEKPGKTSYSLVTEDNSFLPNTALHWKLNVHWTFPAEIYSKLKLMFFFRVGEIRILSELEFGLCRCFRCSLRTLDLVHFRVVTFLDF